eukprot:7307059-Pyramimonas_sp.AAC.1
MPRNLEGIRVLIAEEPASITGASQASSLLEYAPCRPRSSRPDVELSPLDLISFRFVDYDMPRNLAGIRVLTAAEQASYTGPSQAGSVSPCAADERRPHREGTRGLLSQGGGLRGSQG